MKWTNRIIEVAVLACIVMFSFLQGFYFEKIYIKYTESHYDEPVFSSCGNQSLIKTATCLNTQVKKIYSYNLSNYDSKLTESELILQGGTCLHWSNWYADKAKGLGFNITYVTLPVGNIWHRFTVISDGTGYCSMDQTDFYCFRINSIAAEDLPW